MKQDPSLFQYYQEMKNLKSMLGEYPAESTSPDWEQKVQASLLREQAKEGRTMRSIFTISNKQFTSTVLAVVMCVAIVGIINVSVPRLYSVKKEQADFVSPNFSRDIIAGNKPQSRFAQKSEVRSKEDVGLADIRQFGALSEKQRIASGRSDKDASKPFGKILGNRKAANEQNLAPTRRIAESFQGQSYSPSQDEYSGRELMPATQPAVIAGGYLVAQDYPETVDAELWRYNGNFNTEGYSRITENEFMEVTENPLSTFSIDVDTASYSNMRRFLNNNQLPPEDAVRIEEMINYFSYNYPQPKGNDPFSITLNGAVCPWNKDHQLVRVGLQGKTLANNEIPPSNLVFLIDVSGSMDDPNKLPLLKSSFKMLANQLGKDERVAIVVYAGAAGKVLDSTPGDNKAAIMSAIDNLQAGGSTAGGAGITLAYQIAKDNFIKGGNNRVILATDGDFNVGVSSDGELVRLIEEKRKEGVFLTVLGFGTGNYQDSKMEQLANKGNGNYYYIDTSNEAQKVLVNELGSTLFAIAKDVKIQIEFNPAQVKAYRLIGYENRMLAKEDFNDDTKDAGELGAGHTVTALYEIVPADSREKFRNVDDLKYQQTKVLNSEDMMMVKLRYKAPDEDTSKLISQTIRTTDISALSGDFQFAAAVAEFGLLLRHSQFQANASYHHVQQAVAQSIGKDEFGYRAEFIELVKKAASLDHRPEVEEFPSDDVIIREESSGIQFKNQ